MENLRVVNISEHGGGVCVWVFGLICIFFCLFVWEVGLFFLKLWRVTALFPSSLHSCSRTPLFWEVQTDVILLGFPHAWLGGYERNLWEMISCVILSMHILEQVSQGAAGRLGRAVADTTCMYICM